MNKNRLSGSIPGSFGNLRSIENLHLQANKLTGAVPASLGRLKKLKQLRLEYNLLNGTIPDLLGNIKTLQRLQLNDNSLSGELPASLGQLTKLRLLDLENNKLTGVLPDIFGNLSECYALFLNNNQFQGRMPTSVFQLSSMKYLLLSFNDFSGVVPPIASLNMLKLFSVGHNVKLRIAAGTLASAWIGNKPDLSAIHLRGISLPAQFLVELPVLPQLVLLDVSNTNLLGTLDANIATKLPSLVNLIIHENNLTGPIPALPSSTRAIIAFNNNFDMIPPLQALTNLTYVVLDGNRHMAGQLHEDWTAFDKLRVISAQHCSLTGSVPPGLLHLSLGGQLQTVGLRDNLLRGPLVLKGGTVNVTSSMTGVDLGMNSIDGAIPSQLSAYMALAPGLATLRLDENLLSCSLDGLAAADESLSNGSLSVLDGNSFQCPLPAAVSALDTTAASYTCDSAPWQLDMVASVLAVLAVLALGGWFARYKHMVNKASSRRVFALSKTVRISCLLLVAMVLSLVHWGVLHPSVYECAGGMWGSAVYHRSVNSFILLVTLLLFVGLLMTPLYKPSSLSGLESTTGSDNLGCMHLQVPEIASTQVCPNLCPGKSFGVRKLLVNVLAFCGLLFCFVLFNLCLDILLSIAQANAWNVRSTLAIPHGLILFTAFTSLCKMVSNSLLLPVAAMRCLGRRRAGQASPSSEACSPSSGGFVAATQLILATVIPAIATLVQLQACYAYHVPWNKPATLAVEYQYDDCGLLCLDDFPDPECQVRAGIPNCLWIRSVNVTVTIDSPPLWRGTCASAGFRLFAPQATLILAIQAAQVLALALIQWHSGRTMGELTRGAPRQLLQQARRKGCCPCCYHAPKSREAWLPSPSQRRSTSTGIAFSSIATSGGSIGVHTRCSSLEFPLLGEEGPPVSIGRGGPRVGPLHDNPPLEEASILQCCAWSNRRVASFISIQAHVALLMGAVFGAVYPPACVACVAAIGAYALSRRLAPHAQTGDEPVPYWLRSAMLLLFTASSWFAYGPGSMFEGEAAVGALRVLWVLSAIAGTLALWLLLSVQVQDRITVRIRQAACAVCGGG